MLSYPGVEKWTGLHLTDDRGIAFNVPVQTRAKDHAIELEKVRRVCGHKSHGYEPEVLERIARRPRFRMADVHDICTNSTFRRRLGWRESVITASQEEQEKCERRGTTCILPPGRTTGNAVSIQALGLRWRPAHESLRIPSNVPTGTRRPQSFEHATPSPYMKLSDFTYEYPKNLIAKYPAEPRDSARMMVLNRKDRTIDHRHVSDLPEYYHEGDVMVVNDTKVFPARLYGNKEKTGARIEVFLLRELNPESRLWDVIVDPARKIRIGNKLYFENGLIAEVIDNTTSRGRTIRFVFEGDNEELYRKIDEIGQTPLPPYIKRDVEPADRSRYQTIFAEHRGAVAAPTAGLHFTRDLIDALKTKGVQIMPVTLHVGLGTFRPVEVEDLTKHRMDSENFSIGHDTTAAVNRALSSEDDTVTAVGTTVVRALESSLSAAYTLKADRGWTDKFIYPPYEFRITERLLTNFHMPKSTLLMLAAAFAGYDFIFEAYEEAIKEKYRLFSFGDAMLIV